MEDVSDRFCRPRSMFSGILRQATLPPPESPVFSTRPRLVYRFRFASRFRSPLFFLPLLPPLCRPCSVCVGPPVRHFINLSLGVPPDRAVSHRGASFGALHEAVSAALGGQSGRRERLLHDPEHDELVPLTRTTGRHAASAARVRLRRSYGVIDGHVILRCRRDLKPYPSGSSLA